jgi:hypothetical protein
MARFLRHGWGITLLTHPPRPCHPDHSRSSGGGKDLLLFLSLASISNPEVAGAPCLPVLETWDNNRLKFFPRILQRITGKYATLKMDKEKARFSPEPGLFLFSASRKNLKNTRIYGSVARTANSLKRNNITPNQAELRNRHLCVAVHRAAKKNQ